MVVRMARIVLVVALFAVVAACTDEGEPVPAPVTATAVATAATREQAATPAPVPESLPTLTATPTRPATPTPAPVPESAPLATPVPKATATPFPSATITRAPTPTPTPELGAGQRIVFLGDVEANEQGEVSDELAGVVAFYTDRYDIVVPAFTLYFSHEYEPIASVYGELYEAEPPFVEGVGGGWVTGHTGASPDAFILAPTPWRRSSVIAHEYYHLLQRDLLLSADGPRPAPGWLIEGSARYAELQYSTDEHLAGHGIGYDLEALWRWELFARDTPFRSVMHNDAPFTELAADGVIRAILASQYYDLAAAGVAWLVTHSGNPRSHLEFWRLLAASDDWQDAFASAFGVAVDDFVEALELYRSALPDSGRLVSGVVVDLGAAPLDGVHIGLSHDRYGALAIATTATDGSFAIDALDGTYFLKIAWEAKSEPDQPYASHIYHLAVDPGTGVVNGCGSLVPIHVTGADVSGIVARVDPALIVSPTMPVCNEGLPEFVLLSGVALGPDSEPAELVTVCAQGEGPWISSGCARTGPKGTFTLSVQKGIAWLRVSMEGGPEGWYGDGRWVSNTSRRTAIHVGSGDIRDLEVRIPAILSGRVIEPDGSPPNASVTVCVEHDTPEVDTACDRIRADGTFRLGVPDGAISLRFLAASTELGWYAYGGLVANEDERALIHVDGANVAGIEILLR